MNEMMSYGDVARSLNTTLSKARSRLAGLEPTLVAGNGRIVLFDVNSVKDHIYRSEIDLLSFLGYKSREQSYDVLVEDVTLDA